MKTVWLVWIIFSQNEVHLEGPYSEAYCAQKARPTMSRSLKSLVQPTESYFVICVPPELLDVPPQASDFT